MKIFDDIRSFARKKLNFPPIIDDIGFKIDGTSAANYSTGSHGIEISHYFYG